MKLSEKYKEKIIEALKPLNLYKVILFGSYASGTLDSDSDIDLYVVTNDNFIPKNWNEKNEIYLKVSRQVRGLRSEIPIDLIVHTKEMNRKFIELDSQFSRDIIENGVNLL